MTCYINFFPFSPLESILTKAVNLVSHVFTINI